MQYKTSYKNLQGYTYHIESSVNESDPSNGSQRITDRFPAAQWERARVWGTAESCCRLADKSLIDKPHLGTQYTAGSRAMTSLFPSHLSAAAAVATHEYARLQEDDRLCCRLANESLIDKPRVIPLYTAESRDMMSPFPSSRPAAASVATRAQHHDAATGRPGNQIPDRVITSSGLIHVGDVIFPWLYPP